MKGFTFIETLLTVIIIGIIASVAAKVLVAGLDVYSLVVNRNDAFHSARVAMERMEDELIHLKSISASTSSSFTFKNTQNQTASFSLRPFTRRGQTVNCIMRGPGGMASHDYLAGEATQLYFTFSKLDGTDAGRSMASVRRINIDFTIQASSETGTIHLRSEVFPRYFMYSNFQ